MYISIEDSISIYQNFHSLRLPYQYYNICMQSHSYKHTRGPFHDPLWYLSSPVTIAFGLGARSQNGDIQMVHVVAL